MSYETRAYDNEDGDPVIVVVATGTHDVSRLVQMLHSGNCEQVRLAHHVRAQVRRHNGGRAALQLLAAHGGPDLLFPVGTVDKLADHTTTHEWGTRFIYADREPFVSSSGELEELARHRAAYKLATCAGTEVIRRTHLTGPWEAQP